MRAVELFRVVRSYIVAAAVIATAAALVFTIYFTQANLQWTAFLTGILVAAILAEAVRSSRSEWVVMRRTAQLSALKDKLEQETRLRKGADQKIAADKPRMQLIDEVLLTMVALIDTEGVCHYHNRAFRDWLHLRAEQINGRHLREIFGPKTYSEIATAVKQSLDGQTAHYEHTQQMPSGAVYRLSVEHVPQLDHAGKVSGFYFLADDITARDDLQRPHEPAAASATAATNMSKAQDMFVDAFSQQATGQKDAGSQIIAAIQRGEFRLFCQLISPLKDNAHEAEHYEILIRLVEEEESMLSPGAFFPLAEKNGLMPYLDRWVVEHVIGWVSRNKQPKPSTFFINVATATIGDPEFSGFLQTVLKEYDLPGALLCFEIPDTELAIHGASVAEFARSVRQCGCRVALSGFGRGSVSFDLIRGFQVDYLKIDGSIILDMLRNPLDLAKIASIDQVAKKIGVKTVAELVESEEHIAKLKEIGVDFAQGFGISRPRSLEE